MYKCIYIYIHIHIFVQGTKRDAPRTNRNGRFLGGIPFMTPYAASVVRRVCVRERERGKEREK